MTQRLRALLVQLFHRIPPNTRGRLKRRVRPGRVGGLWRVRRLSEVGAVDRGTPLDAWYLEAFVSHRRADVRGRLLVVGTDRWGLAGGSRISTVEVVDADPFNEKATLIADVGEAGSLPAAGFDTVVASDVVETSDDPSAVCRNLWASVAPGGVLLLTVRCAGRLDGGHDLWRLTPSGLGALLSRSCPDAEVEVTPVGNVRVGTAALMGMAAEELRTAMLDELDLGAPLLVHARVRKPDGRSGSGAD